MVAIISLTFKNFGYTATLKIKNTAEEVRDIWCLTPIQWALSVEPIDENDINTYSLVFDATEFRRFSKFRFQSMHQKFRTQLIIVNYNLID